VALKKRLAQKAEVPHDESFKIFYKKFIAITARVCFYEK